MPSIKSNFVLAHLKVLGILTLKFKSTIEKFKTKCLNDTEASKLSIAACFLKSSLRNLNRFLEDAHASNFILSFPWGGRGEML